MKKIAIIFASFLASALLFSSVGCDKAENNGNIIVSEPSINIKATEINEKGELIITYTDGSRENLGVVVGKDGVDGKDGAPGKDGVDGKDGIDGKDGVDGKDGAPGKDGVDGKDGVNGKDGKDGEDGKEGGIIINGSNSDTVYATAKGLLSSVSILCEFENGSGSSGSGVIYKLDKETGDAFIITNYHVVYEKSSNEKISHNIMVMLYGSEYMDYMIPATYVGGSMTYDLAVLHVSGSELLKNSSAQEVCVGDYEDIDVGDSAIAIGNAESMGISATLGSVCVKSEYLGMTASDGYTAIELRVMRIDTSVNHGNSGGGLFNSKGELIGIVNAKHIEEGVEGIGYAIPSSLAVYVVDNIIENCFESDNTSVLKPMMGVQVVVSDPRAVYDEESGRIYEVEEIEVVEVSEGSLAEKYGIMAGDRIRSVTFNDETLVFTRQYQLIEFMLGLSAGDKYVTTVDRMGEGGEYESIDIEIFVTADYVSAVQ